MRCSIGRNDKTIKLNNKPLRLHRVQIVTRSAASNLRFEGSHSRHIADVEFPEEADTAIDKTHRP